MFAEAEADPSLSKEEFKPLEARLRVALLNAQYQRLANANKTLLVVVAGIDGAGKGATVNLLNEWMDPRHIKTLPTAPAKAKNWSARRCGAIGRTSRPRAAPASCSVPGTRR